LLLRKIFLSEKKKIVHAVWQKVVLKIEKQP